jgi:anionic cell wall polymer biosynthesis LytR-Cps2A-Psr (LCP) family protein
MLGQRRLRLVALSLTLAAVLAGSGSLAGPVAAAPVSPHNLRPWLGLAADLLGDYPLIGDVLQAMVGPSSMRYGSDGRLTVLVLGSDHRPTKGGDRTDSIMVVTINPQTRQAAAVSIPRDTARLPLPGNDPYFGKVNSLYVHYKEIAGSAAGGLDLTRKAFAYALGIEIDYVAYAQFTGFDYLVDQLGYVSVDIPAEIRDTRMVDDHTKPPGALFLAGNGEHLGGASATRCYATRAPIDWSKVPACYRALLYVRSRHGTVGTELNSNYKRDIRQQTFLMDALRRVIERGNGTALLALRDSALGRTDFYTDMPITSDADLLALFELVNGAQDQPFLQADLKPPTYAYHVAGMNKNALNIGAVRALAHSWFGPVN